MSGWMFTSEKLQGGAASPLIALWLEDLEALTVVGYYALAFLAVDVQYYLLQLLLFPV